MRRMNVSQAIGAALDAAAPSVDGLTVIHVAGESVRDSGRRLTLPLTDDAQLRFVMGCAAGGLVPFVDLTAVRDGAKRLESAITPLLRNLKIVFRISDRYCPELDGIEILRPANSLEGVHAVFSALARPGCCVILEDPLKAFELSEVAEDDLIFDPDAYSAAEQSAPDIPDAPPGIAAAVPDVPDADREIPCGAPDSPADEAAPAPHAPASRLCPYDPSELARTADLLNVNAAEVALRCCRDLDPDVEVVLELDAVPGEAAVLPPEKGSACLWVGRDRVSLCWDPEKMTRDRSRGILTRTAQALELPARLIMR